jgi:hypothetical protein
MWGECWPTLPTPSTSETAGLDRVAARRLASVEVSRRAALGPASFPQPLLPIAASSPFRSQCLPFPVRTHPSKRRAGEEPGGAAKTGSGAALDSPFPASLLMFAAVPAFMECGELAKKTVGSKAGDKLLVVLPLAAEFVGRGA